MTTSSNSPVARFNKAMIENPGQTIAVLAAFVDAIIVFVVNPLVPETVSWSLVGVSAAMFVVLNYLYKSPREEAFYNAMAEVQANAIDVQSREDGLR